MKHAFQQMAELEAIFGPERSQRVGEPSARIEQIYDSDFFLAGPPNDW